MIKKFCVFASMVILLGFGHRGAEWPEPPDVFVCSDANVSIENVEKSIELWETLGYEFGVLFDNFDCVYDDEVDFRYTFIPNSIIVYPATKALDKKHELGVTSIGFREGQMLYAIIETRDNDERVLAHEFGHALNIRHIRRRGNLMHPYYDSGGWDLSRLAQ